MMTADIKPKEVNGLPANGVQESVVQAGGTKPEAESLEIRRQKLHNSLEDKRKFISFLEGYLGNEQGVTEIKRRIEEALKYLKEVEEMDFKEAGERGISHG